MVHAHAAEGGAQLSGDCMVNIESLRARVERYRDRASLERSPRYKSLLLRMALAYEREADLLEEKNSAGTPAP